MKGATFEKNGEEYIVVSELAIHPSGNWQIVAISRKGETPKVFDITTIDKLDSSTCR
jgi:hypothetical protein